MSERRIWRFAAIFLVSSFLGMGFVGLVARAAEEADAAASGRPEIQVFKTPTCGCCNKWIEHLQKAGFDVQATDLPDLTELKRANGVPPRISSCHTAIVEGYVIEGHVPADDIERLLAERPKVAGLAVPGMPIGSPGMESLDTSQHETYEVVAFGTEDPPGGWVFATHEP